MKAPAIYIHVPFCVSKCAYCDFYSLPCKDRETEKLQERYTDALCRQIKISSEKYFENLCSQTTNTEKYFETPCREITTSKNFFEKLSGKTTLSKPRSKPRASTVFIGGGTPSVLSPSLVEKIIYSLNSCFDIPKDAEFTIEANPETLNSEKLSAYKSLGINRISIGMQSAVDKELKALSRIHTEKSVENAVYLSRKAGFDNISLDLMYGIPYQTRESFLYTLNKASSLSPEHISVYGLQLEEGTPLCNNKEKYTFPNEDEETELNFLAADVLKQNGYEKYEISNYARRGFECKHNLNYWKLGEYFGFGTAAHSFIGSTRYSIDKDVNRYCASEDFSDVTKTEEILTEKDAAEEYIMLSLRLCAGLSESELSKITPFAGEYIKRAENFISAGFMEREGGSVRFTPKGFNVSNTVISEIIYGQD